MLTCIVDNLVGTKERAMATDKRKVLRRIEGDYLLDYATFTGAVHVYVTGNLEEHFAQHKDDFHRRMFVLAVYREEYSAYEDLGAMLDALLTNRRTPEVPLLERLLSYVSSEVKLSKVMKRFNVNSAQELHDRLGLDGLIPPNWAEQFSGLDLKKALWMAADFFFVDCTKNQKEDGIQAFYKIKHALLWVPNAKRYLPNQIEVPAALFKADKSKPTSATNPFTLYAIPMTDAHLNERLRSIHFIQMSLRLIAALRVIALYPEALKRRGFSNPADVWTPYMADVLDFIKQVR